MVNVPIKILIIDDSETAQEILKSIFESIPDFKVAGLAANGATGCQMAKELKPDIISLDLRMPGMDGYGVIEKVMAENPLPIVLVTASQTPYEKLFYDAITLGALEVLQKPTLEDLAQPQKINKFINVFKELAKIKVIRHLKAPVQPQTQAVPAWESLQNQLPMNSFQCIALGSSTGGPKILKELFSQLKQPHASIICAQHISQGFLEDFISWIKKSSHLQFKIVKNGTQIEKDTVYFLPESTSFKVDSALTFYEYTEHQTRPIDNLFESLAEIFGNRMLAGLLSGMGDDGVKGLKTILDKGGFTFVQNPHNCEMDGMVNAAIHSQAAQFYVEPHKLKNMIESLSS